MSSTPLLGESSLSSSKRKNGFLAKFSEFLNVGILSPDSTTYSSVYLMLNAPTKEERNELTSKWRDHKLEELNFVGTVGALLTGCLTSTGAWPDILSNGRDKPWSVRTCWYSGIVFALFAVLTAAQQSLRLHRLSAHRDGLGFIRQCVAHRRGGRGGEAGGEYTPSRLQVYAWQISLVFLVGSVACMIGGMLVLVWVSTGYGPEKRPEDGWWDNSSKMAVTFTAVLGAAMGVFLASQSALTANSVGPEED